jgi:hypothetical protein
MKENLKEWDNICSSGKTDGIISTHLGKPSFRIKKECRKKQVFTLIIIYIM